METKDKKSSGRRRVEGLVLSNKMDKTIVVKAVTRIKHKMLGKYMARRYKVIAHDQKNEASEGDKVLVEEVLRPLSKTKRWVLKKIVEKVQ
jgi:small subunit ribosomal protein S17